MDGGQCGRGRCVIQLVSLHCLFVLGGLECVLCDCFDGCFLFVLSVVAVVRT